jgi:hypothetical protein
MRAFCCARILSLFIGFFGLSAYCKATNGFTICAAQIWAPALSLVRLDGMEGVGGRIPGELVRFLLSLSHFIPFVSS